MNKIKMAVCVLLGMFGADAQDVILENCERGRTEKKGKYIYGCFGDKWLPFADYTTNVLAEQLKRDDVRMELAGRSLGVGDRNYVGAVGSRRFWKVDESEEKPKGTFWFDEGRAAFLVQGETNYHRGVLYNNYQKYNLRLKKPDQRILDNKWDLEYIIYLGYFNGRESYGPHDYYEEQGRKTTWNYTKFETVPRSLTGAWFVSFESGNTKEFPRSFDWGKLRYDWEKGEYYLVD